MLAFRGQTWVSPDVYGEGLGDDFRIHATCACVGRMPRALMIAAATSSAA